jgi:integrase
MPDLPKTEPALVALTKRHATAGTPRGEYWDTAVRGLSLMASLRSATWFAFYTDAAGKRRRERLGTFYHPAAGGDRAPYMTLSQAREAFARLKGEARLARDPYSARDALEASPTVAEIAGRYIELNAARKVTGDQDRRVLKNDILPVIGAKKAAELTRRDIHATLERTLREGKGEMASRILETARKVFAWAIEQDMMQFNPAAGISRPAIKKARARIFSDAEIAALWRELDKWPEIDGLVESLSDQLKLLFLTGCREREIGGARWQEVDFERALLTLPADEPGRSKGREHPHLVPLSAPAVRILKALKLRAGKSAFVFPSPFAGKQGRPDAPATQSRVENAKLRIAPRLEGRNGLFSTDWRIHDIRRTVRSKLSELKIPPHVAELVIGHSMRGIVKVYDRYDYLDEKRAALDRWADALMRIVGEPESSGEVVGMAGRAQA